MTLIGAANALSTATVTKRFKRSTTEPTDPPIQTIHSAKGESHDATLLIAVDDAEMPPGRLNARDWLGHGDDPAGGTRGRGEQAVASVGASGGPASSAAIVFWSSRGLLDATARPTECDASNRSV